MNRTELSRIHPGSVLMVHQDGEKWVVSMESLMRFVTTLEFNVVILLDFAESEGAGMTPEMLATLTEQVAELVQTYSNNYPPANSREQPITRLKSVLFVKPAPSNFLDGM